MTPTKLTFAVIVLVWIACALLSAGIDFSYFQWVYQSQARERRREDAGTALLLGLLLGPVSLVVSFFITGFAQHGIWRPYYSPQEIEEREQQRQAEERL